MTNRSECWKYLCDKADKGTLENHAISLRLSHLKNAVNINAITYDTYYVHRKCITNQHSISYKGIKPYTLTDFGKTLTKYCDSIGRLEINQSLKINQNLKNIDHQKNVIVNTIDYNPDKGNSQIKIPRKSRKRCKKKKKCININHGYLSNSNDELNEQFEDQYDIKINNCISKNLVKTFVRQMNKPQKIETFTKKSLVPTRKSIKNELSES